MATTRTYTLKNRSNSIACTIHDDQNNLVDILFIGPASVQRLLAQAKKLGAQIEDLYKNNLPDGIKITVTRLPKPVYLDVSDGTQYLVTDTQGNEYNCVAHNGRLAIVQQPQPEPEHHIWEYYVDTDLGAIKDRRLELLPAQAAAYLATRRPLTEPTCGNHSPNGRFTCTRGAGHQGDCVAHGETEAVAAWPKVYSQGSQHPVKVYYGWAPDQCATQTLYVGEIVRYDALKNNSRTDNCGSESPHDEEPGYVCTREKGHSGKHVAHAGILTCAIWPPEYGC